MSPETIFLVGFMGVGKTTVGRILADRLGREFLDLDEEIQKVEGRTINDIFRAEGERYFRRVEARLLRALPRGVPQVVATGGGTIAVEANLRFIQERGVAVWLRCPLPLILERCRHSGERPLFRDRKSIEALLASRLPSYSRAAIHVDITGLTPERIAARIVDEMDRI